MKSKDHVVRRWKRIGFTIAIVWGLGMAGRIALEIRRQHAHREWYDHVQLLILKLADRRPADVTPAQWANCLHQTWKLHSSYGTGHFARGRRESFVAAFEERLDGDVGLETIDWIWDEYASCSPRSTAFDRFRPTRPDALDEVDSRASETGPDTSLDPWLTDLREREGAPQRAW